MNLKELLWGKGKPETKETEKSEITDEALSLVALFKSWLDQIQDESFMVSYNCGHGFYRRVYNPTNKEYGIEYPCSKKSSFNIWRVRVAKEEDVVRDKMVHKLTKEIIDDLNKAWQNKKTYLNQLHFKDFPTD